jgi:energy-coupling factor transport system ATP-binding protein
MIQLRDATVSFEGSARPALDCVSLHVRQGSWTAIVGANGSGKTTLLTALAGLIPLRSGSLARKSTRTALLQQDADNQLVATTVRHELALSIPIDVAHAARRARIEEVIARFDLAHLLERNPHRLSGGEKQRLACATVWLEEPDVLLLDEPLAFLDQEARERVLAFVREAHARGAAVVWATPGEDAEFAREVVFLTDGRVAADGGASPARVEVPGRDARRAPGRRTSAGTAVALKIEGASFSHDGRIILQSIDLEVEKGECVGVVGRNSAGKSTLLTLAGGALPPASGRVSRGSASKGGVLYVPQSPERMFFAETVREEIAFGVKHLPGYRGVDRGRIDTIVDESLRAVEFDPAWAAGCSPFELSFGEMRRVAFAIAHALAPELLLLDEPASCLDRAGRAVLARLVNARLDAGAAVVVASHDLSHLEGLCDRVLELRDGRLSATRTT